MTLEITAATGFISCVGSDAWSSLRALAWYGANAPDGVACLFVVDDLHGARAAAETLRRVAAKRWPRLKLILPGDTIANTPSAFTQRFADWKIFRPEITSWVVDVTGATLPVREAVVAAARADTAVTIIACESDGVWWQHAREAGGASLLAQRTQIDPASGIDNGPASDLLGAFSHGVAEVRWRDSRVPLALDAAAVARMVAAGPGANWNWRAMVEAATGAPCGQQDYDLRDFAGTVLTALGVANVRINVSLAWRELKEEPFTIDVTACHNGRLFVFDCQASDNHESAYSARAADAARDIFSRLAVTGVALRPSRWATDAERAMTALTPAAVLLDADACRQIFSRLAALLGTGLPEALREAERGALRFGGRKLPVMTAASDVQRVGAAMTVDDRIFDVWRGAHTADSSTDWPWRAVRVTPDRWFLQGRVMQGGSADELRRRLLARLAAERVRAEVIFFELSGNRRYWHAILIVPGDPHFFPRWLRKWEKVPLVV